MEMNCERVRDEAVAERYLTHRLTEEERDTFEAHFFNCGTCFEEVRTLQALQAELEQAPARATRPATIAWWAAAAAIVIAAGSSLWLVTTRESPSRPTVDTAEAPRRPPAPVESADTVAVADLASIEPPDYIPLLVRGDVAANVRRFDEGMAHYARGDYRQAALLLEPVAREGDGSAAAFYLGIARLMSGDTRGAIDALQQSAARGDEAFAEDTQFFLAKAHLREKRIDRAREALSRVIRIGGTRAAAARALLAEIDRRAAHPRR